MGSNETHYARSTYIISIRHQSHTLDIAFAFNAPKIWNGLPENVHHAVSTASFRKKLKTYLFAKVYVHSHPTTSVSSGVCSGYVNEPIYDFSMCLSMAESITDGD